MNDRDLTKFSRQDSKSDLPDGLAKPAQRALARAGLLSLEQFTTFREADLLQLHGMGPKAVNQIRRALADQGMSFADGPQDAD